MALSRQAKWGGCALLVIITTAAGLLWFGNQADAPASIAQPLAKAGNALSAATGQGKVAEKTRWKDLTEAQQLALAPLAGEWDQLEPLRRQKWLGIIKRYASMKPDEQARVQEKMREWVQLTPAERRQVRQNFARVQKLDPSHKNTQWESYQQLSDDAKQELAAKAAIKPQVANLPTAAQTKVKTVAPIKPLVPTENGSAKAPAFPAAPAAASPGAALSPAIGPAAGAVTGSAGYPAANPVTNSAAVPAANSTTGAAASSDAAVPNASNLTPVPAPSAAQPASSNVK